MKEHLVLTYPGLHCPETLQLAWEAWEDDGPPEETEEPLLEGALARGLLLRCQTGRDPIAEDMPHRHGYVRFEWSAILADRWRLVLQLGVVVANDLKAEDLRRRLLGYARPRQHRDVPRFLASALGALSAQWRLEVEVVAPPCQSCVVDALYLHHLLRLLTADPSPPPRLPGPREPMQFGEPTLPRQHFVAWGCPLSCV